MLEQRHVDLELPAELTRTQLEWLIGLKLPVRAVRCGDPSASMASGIACSDLHADSSPASAPEKTAPGRFSGSDLPRDLRGGCCVW